MSESRPKVDPTSAKEWVESKRAEATPTSAPGTEPHMLGIPKVDDEILGGKYRVEHVIGVGGMGVVVAALHKQLGQRVAIKFLSATMQTPELVDRFIREGQAAVRIKSEHIAPVLDVGVLDTGTPYLMMEYLNGADLGEYLADRGPLPVEEAVDFVLQACQALAVAHAAGIIHRDLKPSNLFMTQRSDGSPMIKVLDFGISKITQQAGQPDPKATLTRPGMMLGSPRYMSPEQLRNASSVDRRADIWGIGIVLHELIAGTPPYDADTFAALCAMIVSDPPTPLRNVAPHAPALLESVILRCVAKDPADRYDNIAELAVALGPIASEESRPMVARIAKILGHIPSKTPPGSYRSTKISAGTPTPNAPSPAHDRTMPLAGAPPPASDAVRGSTPSPLASTDGGSSARPGGPSTSTSSPSALAVSASRLAPKGGSRVGFVLGLAGLLAVLVFAITFLRRAEPAPPVSAAPPPPAPSGTIVPSAPEPAAATTTSAAASVEPTPAPAAPPSAKVAVAPITHPVPARPTAPVRSAPSAAAAPSSTPAQPPPSEADMLNRRH